MRERVKLDEAAQLREVANHGACRVARALLYGESITTVQVTSNEQLAKLGRKISRATRQFPRQVLRAYYMPAGRSACKCAKRAAKRLRPTLV